MNSRIESVKRLRAVLKRCDRIQIFSKTACKFTGKYTHMNNPSPADVPLTGEVNSFTSVSHAMFNKIRDIEMLCDL